MIAEHFYLFSDLNRQSPTLTLDQVFAWGGGAKIITMTDDEEAYLFSMQLILGSMPQETFQKFHDGYWDNQHFKKETLQSYTRGIIFCTNPSFLDYMMDYKGDLMWNKAQREKNHWSQPDSQIFLNGPFSI